MRTHDFLVLFYSKVCALPLQQSEYYNVAIMVGKTIPHIECGSITPLFSVHKVAVHNHCILKIT